MKTKYFLIYAAVGVAFLAVSLWVFLSKGRSAKAIRAKYRLGGIMLTTWAMISAASCQIAPTDPIMTCYDVPGPEQTNNFTTIRIKDSEDSNYNVKAGAVFQIHIEVPSYQKFAFELVAIEGEIKTLQQTLLDFPEGESSADFEVPVDDGISYTGNAYAQVHGVEQEDPLVLSQMSYATVVVKLN